MAVSVQPKIAGLDVLESGLRTLKRSKLLVTPEYKDMLYAVERHHNDLRLAHLTGKAKDLLDQAQRDTKFYNILVKMLCEVKEKRTGEQRQGLRRVYTWYMANKHVLYTGPHFGKEQLKKEAQEVLVKASTPRKAKPTRTKMVQSSRLGNSQSQPPWSATQRNRVKSAPSSRITWHDSSFDWRKDLEKGILNQDHPKVERLNLHDDDDDNVEPELQRLVGETDTGQSTPLNTADTTTTANTEILREARRLSRAPHGSPATPLTPLGEQSSNVEVVSVTPRKIVHPISSMVNPHVTLAVQLEQERQDKLQAQLKMGEKQSRADNLQAWQNFNKNRSYGQDIVDRLNFVGRSGTPNDVRYFAHGQAEMPEFYTSDIITGYAQVMGTQSALRENDLSSPAARHEDQKENVFIQQTLEEFYETADSLYPPRDARPLSRSRIKSAPSSGRMSSRLSKAGLPTSVEMDEGPKRRASAHPHKLGHLLQEYTVEEEVRELTGQEQQTSVKLDTVVKIIDSVSEEMTLYKERLAPEAQAGFRQPMATGLPLGTSPAPSVRLPSPAARSNSPVQGPPSAPSTPHPTPPPRPYSSPLVSRQTVMREGEEGGTPSPRYPKDRCKSAGVIDWRGRVQPDTMRYKWGKTKFGGFTYLKKHLQRPVSLRSAGSTSAGRRPKTAPVSVRDKWKTEKASDVNPRVEGQAASHSMTQINQHDMDSMMTVQYLLGSSNSRADSLASLYSLDEEFIRSLRRSNTPSNAPLEYMSFVASSPAALLIAERRAKSQDQARSDGFDDRLRPEGEKREADHFPLPPNLDDLHIPLDLGVDLAENGSDRDSSIAGEAGEEEDLPDDHLEERREEEVDDGGDEVKGEERWQQSQSKEDVITSEAEKTDPAPTVVTSDLLPCASSPHTLPSQVTTVIAEVITDTFDVRADAVPAESTPAPVEATPAGDSCEVIPEQDSAELAPVQTTSETTPVYNDKEYSGSDKAAPVSVSTQVSSVSEAWKVAPGEVVVEEEQGETEKGGVSHVPSVVPDNRSAAVTSPRLPHKQPLSVSKVWQFSLSQDAGEEGVKPGFILGPSGARTASAPPRLRRKVYCSDCISMASTETATVPKIQRSAGRMPAQSLTPANHMVHFARRHDELMRRAPPPRTPPSIPMPMTRSLTKGRSPRSGPMMAELEHHARKVKSPRALMQHVKDLRSSRDMQDSPTASPSSAESLMSTLQVCRLQVPLPRQRTAPLLYSSSSGQEGLQSILKQSSDLTIILPQEHHEHDHDLTDATSPEKVVTFSHEDPDHPTDPSPETGSADHFTNGLQMPETMSFMRQITSGTSSLHSSGSVSLAGSLHGSEPGTPSSKNLARIGRPIAQVAHVPDPGEVAVAVQKQREAAAAVDIQRIFRGYVARTMYKSLLSEERQRAEDERRAAVEIQRVYRGHLSRRRAIKRRAPNQEMLEWAHNYRNILIANEHKRLAKVEERAEELADNYHSAQSKLSVIGPHVNIYEIYHPKRMGPTKKELNLAAIAIQRRIRGWLIRRHFDKLYRKAAWYGSTFQKLVREYKATLSRVQRKHGVNNPQTPFTTQHMNDYIDTRRRYESVFEKKAFGGELELVDVPSFFKECDLFPSQAEIDEALDVAVRGVEGRGLTRLEMLDMVFYIYTPPATGLVDTRQSTWMNPIIDGVEAKRLVGSEFVEDAPLEVCARLVIESRKERRQKEQAEEKVRREAEEAELLEKLTAQRTATKEAEEAELLEKQRKSSRASKEAVEAELVEKQRKSSTASKEGEEADLLEKQRKSSRASKEGEEAELLEKQRKSSKDSGERAEEKKEEEEK